MGGTPSQEENPVALTKDGGSLPQSIVFTDDQMRKLAEIEQAKDTKRLNDFTVNILPSTCSTPGKELRLVLLGKTGVGKSTTGNLILGRDLFAKSPRSQSVTKTIKEEETYIDGMRVRVIDTPGFFDTGRQDIEALSNKAIIAEVTKNEIDRLYCLLTKMLDQFHDGVHGFLFVLNIAEHRFTKEHEEIFNLLYKQFGPRFLECCYVILTHWDTLTGDDGECASLNDHLTDEFTDKSPLGIVLVKILEKRVIAVENRFAKSQLGKLQREQIVRLVSNSKSTGYINSDIEKHRQDVLANVAGSTKRFVDLMEDEYAKLLEGRTCEEIEGMTEQQKNSDIETVLKKVRAVTDTNYVQERELRETAATVLEGKRDRLTSEKVLSAIKYFVIPLLSLLKEIVPLVRDIISLIR